MELTKIAIIMGSDSDLPIMQDAARVLDEMKVKYELTIVSAHRTPDRMVDYVKKAHGKGIKIIIAGAGGAAHLPGMAASLTHLPVIGVPIKTATMNGLDSMYSIVQMPPGIPVATVAINGAKNAGILAVQMLGIDDANLAQTVIDYKQEMKEQVEDKALKLENEGWREFLRDREGD